ncbi:MAG TPA: hypothetical protein VI749_08900 [Candidatus Omnitrophota bacterium]|nr:hypothetical protein [Candidatus Omnitrophota bacterium]
MNLISVTTFCINAKINDVLVGHAELKAHHQDVILRVIALLKGLNVLDKGLLKHPADCASINGIPGQSVQFPANDTISHTFMNIGHHLAENGPSRGFGGLFLSQDINDL